MSAASPARRAPTDATRPTWLQLAAFVPVRGCPLLSEPARQRAYGTATNRRERDHDGLAVWGRCHKTAGDVGFSEAHMQGHPGRLGDPITFAFGFCRRGGSALSEQVACVPFRSVLSKGLTIDGKSRLIAAI